MLQVVTIIFIIMNVSLGREDSEKDLYKKLRNISKPSLTSLDYCILEKSESMILIGNWSDADLSNFYTYNYISIVLLNVEKSENQQDYITKIKRYKLDPSMVSFKPFPANRFIIQQSLLLFELSLYKLKNSIWWNSEALYFIKDIRMYNSCEHAYDYFMISWKFNILSVVFFCQDLNSKIFLYTYNPYNSYAPKGWMKVLALKHEDGQTFTLFNYEFKPEESIGICQYLNFDKTFTVNKFPIKLIDNKLFYDPNKKSDYKISDVIVEGKIIEAICTALNATVNITPIMDYSMLLQNGIPNKVLNDLLSGKFDMNFVFNYQRIFWKNELNSFIQAGMCYVTNKERIAMFKYILNTFSTSGFFSLLCINLLATVLFSILLKRSIALAAMDVLRAIVGVSTLRQPKMTSHRTVFICIIFLCMMLNFYMQSQWFSLLTAAPIYEREINSISDLIENNYKIYTVEFYQRQYFDVFQNGTNIFLISDYKDCRKLLKDDVKTACARDCGRLKLHFYDGKKLRISEDRNLRYYHVFVFRDDFPLRTKIIKIYRRLFQSGIIMHFSAMTELKNIKNKDPIFDKPEKINLHQLKLTFSFLLVMNAFAIIIFLIELLFKSTVEKII